MASGYVHLSKLPFSTNNIVITIFNNNTNSDNNTNNIFLGDIDIYLMS